MDITEYEAPDGCHYKSPSEYLWIAILGGCGCGSGDLPYRAAEVLRNFGREHLSKERWSVYDDAANEVLAHWLDSKGLIEHGGSVNGSWLTDKGEELLHIINSAPKESEISDDTE